MNGCFSPHRSIPPRWLRSARSLLSSLPPIPRMARIAPWIAPWMGSWMGSCGIQPCYQLVTNSHAAMQLTKGDAVMQVKSKLSSSVVYVEICASACDTWKAKNKLSSNTTI